MPTLGLLFYICFSLFGGRELTLGCIGNEKQALLKFKQSLTDPSNRLSSWFGQDCCIWDGIVCDNITRHVIELRLQNPVMASFKVEDYNKTALVGREVSPALDELKHLEILDLSFNNFLGCKIPEFFGDFKSLRSLTLTYASFAGEVPSSLGNLSNLHTLNFHGLDFLRIHSLTWITHISTLKYLDMNSVDLSQVPNLSQVLDSFPSLISLDLSDCKLVEFPITLVSSVNFSSLSVLNLEGNSFQSTFPLSLCNLTNLIVLSMSDNAFIGQIPSWLSKLQNLQGLDLSSNFFSGSIPTSLCKLSTLVFLTLDENQLSGSIPSCLGTLSTLIFLNLGSNKLNRRVPPDLSKLSNLEQLSLPNNSLSDIISENHFDKLSQLQDLDLSSNILLINVSSNWNPPFQLTSLNLGSCQLGSRFPLWLQTQKAIISISIPNASISGSYHLEDLSPHFPSKIEVLDLSKNLISGPIPQNIGNVMLNLTALILSSNNINGGIPTSLCGMRKLGVIDLSNTNVFEDLPWDCWSGSSNMQIIDLASNNLTGTIPSGFGRLSLLNSLHLSKNRFYGELPLEMETCRKLSVLDLTDNGFSGKIPSWIGGSHRYKF